MSDLLETRSGDVATLTLNRPERLNALTDEMLHGLIEALQRLGADPAVGAIVVTGAGRGFCAGGDVKAMSGRADRGFEARVEGLRWKHQVPLLMRTCPKPVIGMINGVAVGAGFGIALACDIRIAARSARFGTAFAAMGYAGDFGGSWTLTRLAGTAKARELYFSGEMFDSAQAESWGLVTRVVADEALAEHVASYAANLARGPRVAYGYMKRNLHAAETESFATVLDLEATNQIHTAMTEDHKEAVRAFVEKRQPVFRGR
jgi:2-(1,2-epoxy-1,2-dihydrophenyl)acetyl-CoA isomerase